MAHRPPPAGRPVRGNREQHDEDNSQTIISQDPRIIELILRRIALPRSHDGRQRFQITTEIRELIKTDTRNKRKAAVKEAFARHTDWGKVASELRIDRPHSAPVFSINGQKYHIG